ncbi:MAG: HAMP domain-containing histidine kinase, partial [Candidatus Cloacimonetes bacterium]|nr:HAMP domain-containing histidine kinase [Candidatus Cloacimonadota bacterium]
SLIVLNAFFINKYKQSNEAFKNMKFDQSLSTLTFKTTKDSLKAKELLNNFRQSLAATEMIQHEAQIYSAVFLFLLMLISIFIFIFVLYKITKPLKELQSATAKIRKGDFSVYLPETGIKEIKELKQSFNSMSRELEEVQKKLLQAEKEMIWKELSRILAHEIKNPLTPIQLSIQRLEEKYEEDPEKFQEIFPDSVKIINQEISNLQNLARSFSTFAKSIVPKFTNFNPALAIEEILKPYIHKYNLILESDNDCFISFDQTHFYQIITNIVQNAIDASPENNEIKLKISNEQDSVIIHIIDKGKGITPENLPRIFEPYFTKKKKGTGLGLALVKKLIDVNKASINVQSEPGKGTVFKIRISSKMNISAEELE